MNQKTFYFNLRMPSLTTIILHFGMRGFDDFSAVNQKFSWCFSRSKSSSPSMLLRCYPEIYAIVHMPIKYKMHSFFIVVARMTQQAIVIVCVRTSKIAPTARPQIHTTGAITFHDSCWILFDVHRAPITRETHILILTGCTHIFHNYSLCHAENNTTTLFTESRFKAD